MFETVTAKRASGVGFALLLLACGSDSNGSSGASFAGAAGAGAAAGSEGEGDAGAGGTSTGKGGSGGKGGQPGGGAAGKAGKGGTGGDASKGGSAGSGGTAGKGGGSAGKGGGSAGKGGAGGKGGAAGSGVSGSGGNASSGAAGSAGAAALPDPAWHVGGDILPSTLVATQTAVYALTQGDAPTLVAVKANGEKLFETSLAAALGPVSDVNPPAPRVAVDEAGTAWVLASGRLARVDPAGKVLWSVDPSELLREGLVSPSVSGLTVGPNGTAYVNAFFNPVNAPSRSTLAAFGANGEVLASIRVGSQSAYLEGPWFAANGEVQTLVPGDGVLSANVVGVAPDLQKEETRFGLFKAASIFAISPLADGSVFVVDQRSFPGETPGSIILSYQANTFDTTGKQTWGTPLFEDGEGNALEQFGVGVTGPSGSTMVPYGNEQDGSGAGAKVFSKTGVRKALIATGGDVQQVLATQSGKVLMISQRGSYEGTKVSPLLRTIDAQTGATDGAFPLHCVPAISDADTEEGEVAYTRFALIGDDVVVVACPAPAQSPALGGLYAFSLASPAVPVEGWPFPHGDKGGRRRFLGGAGGGGAAGAGGAGNGGSAGSGATAGSGGGAGEDQGGNGGTGGGGNDVIPTTCDEAHGAVGCCSADGGTLYYCAGSGVLTSAACSLGSCGWNANEGYYDCERGGLPGPAGKPQACGP